LEALSILRGSAAPARSTFALLYGSRIGLDAAANRRMVEIPLQTGPSSLQGQAAAGNARE
jgi:hypothetical protein